MTERQIVDVKAIWESAKRWLVNANRNVYFYTFALASDPKSSFFVEIKNAAKGNTIWLQ